MTVVAVVNNKGGVGKTTVTANIGAQWAYLGRRVLLVDLDPQASLTFSFYRPEEWRDELAGSRTIKQWYDAFPRNTDDIRLADLVSRPPRVNAIVARGHGQLDLIASDLSMGDVELNLAAELSGVTLARYQQRYLSVYRRLAEGLEAKDLGGYDLILLDCPPNFGVITRTAVVASDHLLIPARPDQLSTLGVDHLERQLRELVADFNAVTRLRPDPAIRVPAISPIILGVVFTMVQYYAGQPIAALRQFITRTSELGLPVFEAMVRDSKSLYANAPQEGVPVILANAVDSEVGWEMGRLVAEFVDKLGGTQG